MPTLPLCHVQANALLFRLFSSLHCMTPDHLFAGPAPLCCPTLSASCVFRSMPPLRLSHLRVRDHRRCQSRVVLERRLLFVRPGLPSVFFPRRLSLDAPLLPPFQLRLIALYRLTFLHVLLRPTPLPLGSYATLLSKGCQSLPTGSVLPRLLLLCSPS